MDTLDELYDIKNGQLSFEHIVTDNPLNNDFKIHIHDYYEIYYFISGNISFYIEGKNISIKKGDLLVVNSRELHKPCICGNSKEPYERIVIHFKPEYVYFLNTKGYNLCNCFEMRKLGCFNKFSREDIEKYEINKEMKDMEYYFKKDLAESSIMVFTIFTQMLIRLNKIYLNMEYPIFRVAENDVNKKVQLILNYINNNLSEKITLDMLQKKFFINKYYMCHIFKKSTGFTIQKYIIYKRLIKARELLSKGVPVMQVSSLVGFNDYSNFYRLFKKVFGFSPKKG